ncbi:uncharacterized protein LOC120335289 isoform X2 [Styela clava]
MDKVAEDSKPLEQEKLDVAENLPKPSESSVIPMETTPIETKQPDNMSSTATTVTTSSESILSEVEKMTTSSEIAQSHTLENKQEPELMSQLPDKEKDIPMDIGCPVSSTADMEQSVFKTLESAVESSHKTAPSQLHDVPMEEKDTNLLVSLSITSSVSASSVTIPVNTTATIQPQQKSIFSSLFPSPVAPLSKLVEPVKVEKPESPLILGSGQTLQTVPEQHTEVSPIEDKTMEVEPAIPSTDDGKVSSPAPKTVTPASSSEIINGSSEGKAVASMIDSPAPDPTIDPNIGKTDPLMVPVTESASTSTPAMQDVPMTVPVGKEIKTEVKHPPIATKTMKREQRKTSTSSPTVPGGETRKTQRAKSSSTSPGGGKSKKKRPPPKETDNRNDFYCWVCHKEGEVLCCELCPRVFHAKCLSMTEEPEGDWFCPECEKITEAECKETQSRAMSMLTIDQFSLLLKYVIQRMKLPMSEPFHEPVDTKIFTDYYDYVFHPMDLSTIEKSVKKRKYGCPEAFILDFKWVIHNCIIYNSQQSKLTQTAKAMLKVAERELNEIEVCPECYLNSCRKRENWFCEPCKELHPLVWAKLQGFPHWPAKALRIEKGMVDVRFFGQHDRAWIPLSGCYLISKELPLPVKNKKKSKGPGMKGGLDGAMQEMQGYIENIKKITGEFEFAPPRTLLTHCDLYRKTMSSGQAGKQQAELEAKGAIGTSTSRTDSGTGIKAKVELKDMKDPTKLRGPGSTTPKKGKMVTTSGEHPNRPFATKKKKASMEFLNKTIESCKASLGIEKIQDVKMNSGSEETTSSSDDDDNDNEEGKEKIDDTKSAKDTPSTSTAKPSAAPEDDDSDAELVIDLGDMDDTTNADANKAGEGKSNEVISKKRKNDDGTKPLKSILLNSAKPTEKEDRKKMLAKALSEKIATGKRKHGVEDSPSGASPSTKIRRTHEDRRSGSPIELIQKSLPGKSGLKDKEKKKSHSGKYLEKDGSGKVKSGILKSSESGLQRKDSYPSEKRFPDSSKHKHKDGAQKLGSKKPPDKSGKLDKSYVPTGADTRKLFNGGRIPRKNPSTNIGDEEQISNKDPNDDNNMETNQIHETRRSLEQAPSNPHSNGPRHVGAGLNRQLSLEQSRKSIDENTAMENLKKYSDKVMDTVQKVFYEMYTDMMVPMRNAGNESNNAATATAMHEVAQMRLELERLKWMHEQEIAELKHNHDLTVAEIRQSLEYEKKQLLLDAKVQAEEAKIRAVDEAKRKQWCAYCNKEAIFYCCWNTSYCDYPCQQKHWPQHMNTCTQARESGGGASTAGGTQAMETSLSPPSSTGKVSTLSSKPISTNVSTSSTQLTAKPTSMFVSPGRATITISASPGHLSRLTSGSKQTLILPPSVSASKPSFTSTDRGPSKIIPLSIEPKPKTTSQTISEEISDKTMAPVQQKSGLAISAIGARLMAAKQRTNIKDPIASKPTKTVISKRDSPVITEDKKQKTSDHVKTTLDSPLSPGANPPSPKDPVSSLKTISKVGQKSEDITSVSKETKSSDENLDTEKPKLPIVSSSEQTAVQMSSSAAPVLAVSMATTSKPQIKGSTKPYSAIFSSPSAVASLIADMGTPLSSTLSSPESSSSFSDTPEKKPDVSKVQLSFAGSAFTKVVPDVNKPIPIQSSKDEKPSTANLTSKIASVPTDTSLTTFKPIDDKNTVESANTKVDEKPTETVPLVAPVLADSYLSNLQKTLVEKIGTSPIPPIVPDSLPPTAGNDDNKDLNIETKNPDTDELMEVKSSG